MAEKIVVLGATGYVGTRLVTKLLQAGRQVRATSRNIGKLRGRHWSADPNVELVETDVLDLDSLTSALEGCDSAYYLVHSMNKQTRDFANADRKAAENMIVAADQAALKQIIYLGGLGDDSPELSKHLKSRAEVGEVLRSGNVPVTTLKAAMIIGSGSASFEILRYLVERLPVMITPKWVSVDTQPIGIANVLTYLTGCLGREETLNRTFDIGGPNVLRYRDLMQIYAEEAELDKRTIIPVPVFTPTLSSYWIHLVTPVPAYIGRPLAEGLRNPTICRENDIQQIVKQDLLTCRAAIRSALDKTQYHKVESHWTDAGKIWPVAWSSEADEKWAGGTIYEDKRSVVLNNTPEEIWKPLVRIGGATGYYYGDWLWRLRGVLDKLIGGVGLRRGRRNPDELSAGDALDFWRVRDVDKHKSLLLVAEMKLPGEAVLEFKINEISPGKCELTQTAKYLPKGLLGMLYWRLVTPLHDLIFDGMLLGIARAVNNNSSENPLAKLTVARAHK
ncbi:MAG: SDR family oxidoreductase [Candidatus Melainabacteria bacterium]|nr:SDR family oxidoreductase [Candidatus Melainabacteria bacterium]